MPDYNFDNEQQELIRFEPQNFLSSIQGELMDFGSATINVPNEKIFPCEWCIQFDNEEPQAIMSTSDESASNKDNSITFTLTNSRYADLQFHANGRVFKIFARPKK